MSSFQLGESGRATREFVVEVDTQKDASGVLPALPPGFIRHILNMNPKPHQPGVLTVHYRDEEVVTSVEFQARTC